MYVCVCVCVCVLARYTLWAQILTILTFFESRYPNMVPIYLFIIATDLSPHEREWGHT